MLKGFPLNLSTTTGMVPIHGMWRRTCLRRRRVIRIGLYALVAFLLLDVSKAQVSSPAAIGTSSNSHALLGSPRYRGSQSGDTLVLMVAQLGSDQTGWVISYDRGQTWSDVRARWMATERGLPTWWASDHSAAWFAEGLHIVSRAYRSDDPAFYRYVASPCSGEPDMETVDIPASGTDTYYPVVVANNRNDVWVFDMNEGGSRDNLRYWHTDTRFDTPATVGRVCTMTEDPQNQWRMGAIMGRNGFPIVCVYDNSLGFAVMKFNGSTWDSTHVTSQENGQAGRFFCFTEVNGRVHLAWGNGGVLQHHYEQADGTYTTGEQIDTYSSGRVAPQFCVYGDGADAKLFVAYYSAYGPIHIKSWTESNGWTSSRQLVTAPGHNGPDPQMMPYVPGDWGFVPVFYQDLGSNTIFYVEVAADTVTTADVIPPAAITDLSVSSDSAGQ